jgi:hypothetical protein
VYLILKFLDLVFKRVNIIFANDLISVPVKHLERSEAGSAYLGCTSKSHRGSVTHFVVRILHQLNEAEVGVLKKFDLV